MKITLETLGCKLNQAETEKLSRLLTAAGHKVVDSADKADIYILNTCTVTRVADAKSRHLLRLAHRLNPNACLVATGCYAKRAPGELESLPGVQLIIGDSEKNNLLELLEERGLIASPDLKVDKTALEAVSRTRAFIKIQDGCNNFCSYCIVPLVRGGEKSVPAERIVAEINNRVTEGVKEVILTGTEVGAYHNNEIRLKGLLKRILAETSITRLRLSSLQPQEITTELISLWQDERLCPHFHLSLQNGSDGVLKRMKRRYSTLDYLEAVSLIRRIVLDVAITTDIISGFPGETEAEFEESYEFSKKLGFARIHVFPYSIRPGTEASGMPSQINDKVKRERSQKLLALAGECSTEFRNKFTGRILLVLWEHQSGGVWAGHTGNYMNVYTKSDSDLFNRLIPAKLVEIREDGMWGEVVR